LGLQDTVEALVTTPTGDCYYIGHQYDGVNNDAMIFKYDSSGTAQFYLRYEKTFMDTTSTQNESFYSGALNGGYIYALGTQYSGSNDDLILNKYDSNGNLIWNKSYDSGATDHPAKGLAVDSSGNMYILFTRTSGTTTSLRMAKYTTSGTRSWVKTYSLPGGNASDTFKYDTSSGNLVAVSRAASGYNLSKFDLSGNLTWTTAVSANFIYDFAIDSSSNIILPVTSTTDEIAVKKYTSAGSLSWTYNSGYTTGPYAFGIAIDSSNNIYVGGYRPSMVGWNSILFSVSSTGTVGFSQEDNTNQYQAYESLGFDSSGNLCATGLSNTTSGTLYHSFIKKFNTGGTLLSQRTSSQTYADYSYLLGFDTSDGVYSAGTLFQTPSGDQKIFLGKY